MSEERYDLVIFGATGFTGQFVVEELVRVQDEESGGLTMAVAGRNMEKLQKVLEQASKQTGIGLQQILSIKAEATDMASDKVYPGQNGPDKRDHVAGQNRTCFRKKAQASGQKRPCCRTNRPVLEDSLCLKERHII